MSKPTGVQRGTTVRELPTQRPFLPPHPPALNPAEPVFAESHCRFEGRIYRALVVRQAVVEGYLPELAADPVCVRDCAVGNGSSLPSPRSPPTVR